MLGSQVKNLEPSARVRIAAKGAAGGTTLAIGLAGIAEWLHWDTPPTVIALVAGALGWFGGAIAANGLKGLWGRLMNGVNHP